MNILDSVQNNELEDKKHTIFEKNRLWSMFTCHWGMSLSKKGQWQGSTYVLVSWWLWTDVNENRVNENEDVNENEIYDIGLPRNRSIFINASLFSLLPHAVVEMYEASPVR